MQLYHEYRLKIQMARKVKGVIFFNDNFEIAKRTCGLLYFGFIITVTFLTDGIKLTFFFLLFMLDLKGFF